MKKLTLIFTIYFLAITNTFASTISGQVLATTSNISTSTASTTISTTTVAKAKKVKKIINNEDRKTCDVFVGFEDNILALASTSEIAQVKLADIKVILEEEIEKRNSLVDSIKSLLSFRKTESTILANAKVNVEEAKDFYKDLDDKLSIEQIYLDKTVCEKAIRKELLDKYKNVDILTKSEDVYRKDLAKKLKTTIALIVEDKKEKSNEK